MGLHGQRGGEDDGDVVARFGQVVVGVLGRQAVGHGEAPVHLAPAHDAVDAGAHFGNAFVGAGVGKFLHFAPGGVQQDEGARCEAHLKELALVGEEGTAEAEAQAGENEAVGEEFVHPCGEQRALEEDGAAAGAAEVEEAAEGGAVGGEAALGVDLEVEHAAHGEDLVVLQQQAEEVAAVHPPLAGGVARRQFAAQAEVVLEEEARFGEAGVLHGVPVGVGLGVVDIGQVVELALVAEAQLEAQGFVATGARAVACREAARVAEEAVHERARGVEIDEVVGVHGARGLGGEVVEEGGVDLALALEVGPEVGVGAPFDALVGVAVAEVGAHGEAVEEACGLGHHVQVRSHIAVAQAETPARLLVLVVVVDAVEVQIQRYADASVQRHQLRLQGAGR